MTTARSAPIDQRDADRIVLSSIALALIGLTLVELVVTWASHSNMPMRRRVFFAENNVWLFLPVGFFVTLFGAPLGWRGLLASAASLTLLSLTVLNFRGMWVWQGTFDRFDDSALRWIVPLISGAVLALPLLAVPFAKRIHGWHRANRWWTGGVAVAAVASFYYADAFIMGSEWPPTRFIALAAALVVLLVLGAVER